MEKELSIVFENIRSLCKKKGIPVSTLEESAEVPLGTVANWSKERHWMIYLKSIAQTLGVPIDSLFYDDSKCEIHDNSTIIPEIVSKLENFNIDYKTSNVIIEIARLLSDNYSNDRGK